MNSECVNRIEMLETGELFLGIANDGKSVYQYIYREAAGVYWDPKRKGFKSTELKNWTVPQWFAHIVETVQAGLRVQLFLGEEVAWKKISDSDKLLIQAGGESERPSGREPYRWG